MDTGETRTLSAADIEIVRFCGEKVYGGALTTATPKLNRKTPVDGAKIRRFLMARSLLLSEGMAPGPYAAARLCAQRLGVQAPIEIYQAAGSENAAMHHCPEPVLLEIQGRLLSLLDAETLQAVMGHELGHYLAHGQANPYADAAHLSYRLLASEVEQEDLLNLARRLSMSMELTADRFGLLACGDLDAALRLEMVAVTGLAASELTWDTKAYLEQCKTLVEGLLDEGGTSLGYSHPEHSLRAYALWLFSESEVYCQLTGRGPGSRTIASVDEQLMQVLGHSQVSFGNACAFEEPQIELQECALSACVLVACCDGDLNDSEVQAIERVFAHLLPHWRELLDPEEALARFQELAPLLYASGPRAQRALFALLTHVLAADGECRQEEIEQILAIGAALGCPALFRSLMPSVIAASELSITVVEDAPVRSIPMAAEVGQVQAALKVFFERVKGRGGESVSARRLLRLSGTTKNTASVRKDLQVAALRAGLEIRPELGDELDLVHQLAPTSTAATPKSVVTTAVSQSEDELSLRLRKALTKLRDKLVSGDGRSPSIRLRSPRIGRAFDLFQLEDVATGQAERVLQLVAAATSADMVSGADADAHEGSRRALSALVALDRENQSRREETGADDLYVGYPFLTGLVGGYLLRGPLILYPVGLARAPGRVALVPTPDESPIANQALLRLLMRQKQKTFAEDLAERANLSAAEGPHAMVEFLDQLGIKLVPTLGQLFALRDRNAEFETWRDDRLEIEDCAVLGLFPQSASDLLQDYDDLLAQLQEGKDPGRLLACAAEVLPAELKALVAAKALPAQSPSVQSPPDPLPVIYADPVQRQVLLKSRTARALVVDGPPGTGKSQVIVNLVADALMRGEKVAVVCEKRAALDVVVNRLEGLGFRHLLALVHDVLEDRRALYHQVAARIEDDQPRPRPAVSEAKLRGDLAFLDARLAQLSAHLASSMSGISLGQAYTLMSGLDVPLIEAEPSLVELPLARIGGLADALQALAPFASLWRDDSPWLAPSGTKSRAGFSSISNDDARVLLSQLRAAAQARLDFDGACALVTMPPVPGTVDQLLAAKTGLEAIVASRSARASVQDKAAFWDLFTLASSEPERLKAIAAAQQAVQQMDEAYSLAGLGTDAATQTLLSRSQSQLATVAEVLRQATSESQRALISAWLKTNARSDLSGALLQGQSTWRERSADVMAFEGRVEWADTPDLAGACARIRQEHSSIVRFLRPGWWRACKTIRVHLSQHWPQQAAADISSALLDAVQQRRGAAQAWSALDALSSAFGRGGRVVDRAEADVTLRDAESARDHADLIVQAESQLRALGIWPAPTIGAAWAGWKQRIDAAVAAIPATVQARRHIAELQALLPNVDLQPTQVSLGALIKVARTVIPVFNARRLLQPLGAWPAEGNGLSASVTHWDIRTDSLLAVLSRSADFETVVRGLQAALPWLDKATAAEQLQRLALQFPRDIARLVESDRLLAKALEQHLTARSLLLTLASRRDLLPQQWADAVHKAWAHGVTRVLEAQAPDATAPGLMLDEEEAIAAQYRSQSDRSAGTMAQIVLAHQDENAWLREPAPAKGARRTPVQSAKEGILREARKRSALPLRSFVRRYVTQGLLEALPVWLLSPETMAQLFPREEIFDLIILDEASQCTVENGLPVLMRGKRVVVAGDERQMPPSNFFRAASDDEAEPEGQPAQRDVLDDESLLVLARSRTSHQGLAWHYRCQYEELIAFSNHAIYGGALKTIPAISSRTAPAAVHWHAVENAAYEEGVNVVEAEVVVSLLKTLIDHAAPPTIGVVTFNMVQRRAILDAIDKRRAEDPAFGEIFDRQAARERIDERPFVKNIENVQGDERDVIVFSLGHAPRDRIRKNGHKEAYVPARFGPVGQRGGERRLNVAVSRAKQAIHIVSSFDPSMLSVASVRNEGPRLFKGFLEFAKAMAAGNRSDGSRVLDLLRGKPLSSKARSGDGHSPNYVPLKVQILIALEREGYKCELDVGASDFRVSLAVIDPADPHRYKLGVVCVEGEHIESSLEAHLHIPGVLKTRGWTLVRINSRDWGTQREAIIARIAHLIDPSK